MNSRRVTKPALFLIFALLILFTWLLLWSDATHKVDMLLHDSWVRLNVMEAPDDVVIAAIDHDSVSAIGRWPWPRAEIAELLESIEHYNVRAVIIDVLFTESADLQTNDIRVAQALEKLPKTVLPVLTEPGRSRHSVESVPVGSITRVIDALGHINLHIDEDGIVRRVFLKAGYNYAHWSILPLAALELLNESPASLPGVRLNPEQGVGQWVHDYEVLIPFYGGSGTFPRVSVVDIMRGEVPPDLLADKVLFIGFGVRGLGDVVPTPVSALDEMMAGVEVHANVFSALRDGLMVTTLNPRYNIVMAAILLSMVLLVYSRAALDWGIVATVAAALIPIVTSYLLYRFAHIWYAPLTSSLPVLMLYLFWSGHRLKYINRFLEREREKSDIRLSVTHANNIQALAKFFESAQRHLPLKAWRFSAGRHVQAGGDESLPPNRVDGGNDAWALQGDVYARRYTGKPALHIEFQAADVRQGVEIAELIDSLSRVRSTERASMLSGSIERLQTNALLLGEQLDWLRGVKAFAESMLAGSPAGFVVWNAAGECVRSNALTHQLVPEFAPNGQLADFIASIGRDATSEKDALLLQNLVLHCEPWQVTHKFAEQEIIINFRAVGDSLSKRLVCASIVDVSEIRTSERARAELVDYLSHDLRSPLISALCLLDDEHDPRIERNINSSLSMMDNLLHVARADSLSHEQFQPVLLNDVLDNALDQLLPQALNAQIKFDVHVDEFDFWVSGDASSLERAFVNIIGNAIKYAPQNTGVAISLLHQESLALFIVDDQGPGIAPDVLDKLFTRFKRDEAIAGQYKGIGLGLALVSQVIKLHEGTVDASNIANGTRIRIRLPLEESEDYAMSQS